MALFFFLRKLQLLPSGRQRLRAQQPRLHVHPNCESWALDQAFAAEAAHGAVAVAVAAVAAAAAVGAAPCVAVAAAAAEAEAHREDAAEPCGLTARALLRRKSEYDAVCAGGETICG